MTQKKTYVLKSQWNHIVKKHRLGKGDVVQVWSFQAIPNDIENGSQLHLANMQKGDYGELHLALVLVKRDDQVLEEEGSKGSLAIASTNGRSSSVCNNGASGSVQ
ncbi:hypothetical protein C1H46_009853 [Malus baccata]|uniref:TF-B3 domain-containing protein n=1 Tax=Malus baccata TaxID=106549 RepID=A0A540N0I1_MALBA|nr:hypothetical protein C1H46_009853 [Malus baccata]